MNQLILITGGSSGIGKATARILVNEGAQVILVARNQEKLEATARELDPSGERVSIYSIDLGDPQAVQQGANQIAEERGIPDVVINSAGAGEWLSLEESSTEHYFETIQSPYLATAHTVKVFYDLMRKRGTGHFVIVNSVASYVPIPGAIGYATSRSAMQGFAQSLQADLHTTDFKVSLISLGKVDSPYFTTNARSEERIPKVVDWLVRTLTEEQAGRAVAQLVHRPKNITIKPAIMRFLIVLSRYFPGTFRWAMRRTGYQSSKSSNS